jgi:hypothetical protein
MSIPPDRRLRTPRGINGTDRVLRKSEISAISFPFAKSNRCEALAVRMGAGMAFETIYARPEAGSDFSVWIRRNPLKSLDCDE